MPETATSTLKNFRERPAWFRALNSAWRWSYPIGTEIRLTKDDLISRAKKATGLSDLGSDFSDEPLEKLLWSVNNEANLHPIGRFITRERFVGLLNIRLRAEYYFRKYPEILEQDVYPSWIIIGLQRTGTTKLQRLLAVDPDHRVIPSWEVINPVPMDLGLYDLAQSHRVTESQSNRVTESQGDNVFSTSAHRHISTSAHQHISTSYPNPKDKRISVAKTSVAALKLMSPGFFAIHPIDAMQPEEDILMLDVSFLSTTPEAMMNVPSYANWLEQTDQSPAYAYAAKLLKFLQRINPAKRWMLKTPHHLEFPELIEKHFGDVHFLWPHRRIYESVPSFLSMVTYNQMIFSNDVDVQRIARHWVRKTGYMLDKALGYRLQGNNTAKFTDIYYKDLITDSIQELDKIYRQNGGLTDELIARFKKHEEEHPHRKHGAHNYSLADFGLTESDIDNHTANYQQFINSHYGREQAEKVQ
jgi:hypothetical protein